MDENSDTQELMSECARLLRIIEKRTRPPAKPTKVAKHGTGYGYEKHLREGTMCDECRQANTERQRTKRERARAERDLL